MGVHDPVLVIGGGFAGLAAATNLAQRGVPVTVLEANAHLGGRARSFVEKTTGDVIDNGQHLFMGCYTATLEFLARIGAQPRLRWAKRLAITYSEIGRPRFSLRSPNLPAPWHVVGALLCFRGLSLPQRLRAMRVGLWLRLAAGRLNEEDWSRRSAQQWLESLGQGPRIRHVLWDPITIATINLRPEQARADLLIRVLSEIFLGRQAGSRYGLAIVGLSELYTVGAVDYIENRGGTVRTSARVDDVLLHGGSVRGVRGVRGVQLTGGEQLPARAVICTVPHHALAQLIQQPDLRAKLGIDGLDRLGTSPILGVTFWLDRPVMSELFLALLGTETQWVFNKTAIGGARSQFRAPDSGARAVQVLAAVISASAHLNGLSPLALAQQAQDDLCRHLPAMRRARVLHRKVIHEKRATFAARPGTSGLRPACRTAVGGLFLAGDWTDTGLPATIEGAVLSGERAAADAAAWLAEM